MLEGLYIAPFQERVRAAGVVPEGPLPHSVGTPGPLLKVLKTRQLVWSLEEKNKEEIPWEPGSHSQAFLLLLPATC